MRKRTNNMMSAKAVPAISSFCIGEFHIGGYQGSANGSVANLIFSPQMSALWDR